ncbi:MAG: phosphotyrosine protein phosphatase [Lachnospiraceae bacterium]
MSEFSRIIFVAEEGNSRAPLAAEILKKMKLKKPLEILSRGLVVLFPEPLNQKMEAVMISNGLATEGFRSKELSSEDFSEHTLIICLDQKQQRKILEKFDQANDENVHVLTELVGDELEIIDPYGGTLQAYGLCYETLVASIRKLVNLL